MSHEEESDADDDADFNATVLSLAYWKENLDSNKAIDETLDPLVDYDETVRYLYFFVFTKNSIIYTFFYIYISS